MALRNDLVQSRVQCLDAIAEQTSVGFQLRFTWAPETDTTLLPLQVRPAAHQARRQVFQLRQLDLQLTFEAARPLRKDVEDQPSAIQHSTLQKGFEIAFLAR
jgi:hypothetical protein